MRSDSEIKAKIVELLEMTGDDRTNFMEMLDQLDVKALQVSQPRSHSVRGMVSALYWTLGYSFQDIREQLVERVLSPSGPQEETE